MVQPRFFVSSILDSICSNPRSGDRRGFLLFTVHIMSRFEASTHGGSGKTYAVMETDGINTATSRQQVWVMGPAVGFTVVLYSI